MVKFHTRRRMMLPGLNISFLVGEFKELILRLFGSGSASDLGDEDEDMLEWVQ